MAPTGGDPASVVSPRRHSAGLLLHRRGPDGRREVLIGHLGGPFWARKDAGAWSIPKGELNAGESAPDAAVREFTEELGLAPPPGPRLLLGTVRQRGGKQVTVFAQALEDGDTAPDLTAFAPGTFELEWPPRSGRRRAFPELDRVGWFDTDHAATLLVAGQREFLDRLATDG